MFLQTLLSEQHKLICQRRLFGQYRPSLLYRLPPFPLCNKKSEEIYFYPLPKNFIIHWLGDSKEIYFIKKNPKNNHIHKLLFSYKAYLSSGSESFIYIVYFTILIPFFFFKYCHIVCIMLWDILLYFLYLYCRKPYSGRRVWYCNISVSSSTQRMQWSTQCSVTNLILSLHQSQSTS